MLKKIITLPAVAAVAALLMPSKLDAWGAAHAGYTHVDTVPPNPYAWYGYPDFAWAQSFGGGKPKATATKVVHRKSAPVASAQGRPATDKTRQSPQTEPSTSAVPPKPYAWYGYPDYAWAQGFAR